MEGKISRRALTAGISSFLVAKATESVLPSSVEAIQCSGSILLNVRNFREQQGGKPNFFDRGIDTEGLPIQGAEVVARSNTQETKGVTDQNGRAELVVAGDCDKPNQISVAASVKTQDKRSVVESVVVNNGQVPTRYNVWIKETAQPIPTPAPSVPKPAPTQPPSAPVGVPKEDFDREKAAREQAEKERDAARSAQAQIETVRQRAESEKEAAKRAEQEAVNRAREAAIRDDGIGLVWLELCQGPGGIEGLQRTMKI